MTEHTVLPLKPHPGMPRPAPLPMPVQDLGTCPPHSPDPPRIGTVIARLITFGGGGALAAGGTCQMLLIVAAGGVTGIEAAMTAVFALTFGWMSIAATSALAGIVAPPEPHVRLVRTGGKLTARTALVMPVFREDPLRTTAALQVMAEGLRELGESGVFEIVVLSDSSDAECWVAETQAVDRLSERLQGVMPVWYRRRWENSAKKAGNIKDFVENWGGRYECFIVLDADSLMTPEALVTLVAAMQADPRLGILQTVPGLACGQTFFARLQQFAARIYGPVVARGVSAWQGSDGNFWGHNAIIRTRAFAACCGLPDLPGPRPLGGAILSHDFVEAALMRRGGWRVEMAPRLGGSWEESPPSLIDAAIRDRRWAQGNLQHSKVIGARGLSLVSRTHLAMGIMSYAVSPLWLAFIVLGFAAAIQNRFTLPEAVFGGAPVWPGLDADPQRTILLFALTLGVLLLPKLLGLFAALLKPELRRGCGGAHRLLASFAAELLASALLAPIMMAINSRHIYEILSGRDAGWTAQRRDGHGIGWGEVWRAHPWHTLAGAGMAAVAWWLSPATLAWLSPTVAALLFAAPLSRASGSAGLGALLRRLGLLATPEELAPHPLFARRDAVLAGAEPAAGNAFEALVTDAEVRNVHYRWAGSIPRRRGAPDPAYLTAGEKALEARVLEEALAWLEPRERVHIAAHRTLADHLAGLPRQAAAEPAGEPARSSAGVDLDTEQAQIRPPAA